MANNNNNNNNSTRRSVSENMTKELQYRNYRRRMARQGKVPLSKKEYFKQKDVKSLKTRRGNNNSTKGNK